MKHPVMLLARIAVLSVPILYGITHAYLPLYENPTLLNDTQDQIQSALLDESPQTLRELEQHTSTNFMITWIATRKLAEKQMVVNCPHAGIALVGLHCLTAN